MALRARNTDVKMQTKQTNFPKRMCWAGFKAEKAGELSSWDLGLSLKQKAPFGRITKTFLVSKMKNICLSNPRRWKHSTQLTGWELFGRELGSFVWALL